MDIKQQTKNVAAQGRFGDSMLLHVNPAEVKGLASAVPLTVNPETGQPEAFLPFLAPMLGSLLGPSILGGLGGLGLSSAALSGIGAGLATYVQTGGSGKKALLSGLTAGLGGKALSDVANPGFIEPVQPGTPIPPAPTTGPVESLQNIFSGGLDEGVQALGSAAMTPTGMLAGTAAGTASVMQSQEEFERMLAQMDIDEEERKRLMYEKYPEQIPMASGGKTGYLRGRNVYFNGNDDYYNYDDGNVGVGNNPFPLTGGYNLPARRAPRPIPRGFMPGFQPEFSYFENINPTATDLGFNRPVASSYGMRGPRFSRPPNERGPRFGRPPMFAGYGNPFMQSPTYQTFYGTPQMQQILNPYARFVQQPMPFPIFEQPVRPPAPPSIGGPGEGPISTPPPDSITPPPNVGGPVPSPKGGAFNPSPVDTGDEFVYPEMINRPVPDPMPTPSLPNLSELPITGPGDEDIFGGKPPSMPRPNPIDFAKPLPEGGTIYDQSPETITIPIEGGADVTIPVEMPVTKPAPPMSIGGPGGGFNDNRVFAGGSPTFNERGPVFTPPTPPTPAAPANTPMQPFGIRPMTNTPMFSAPMFAEGGDTDKELPNEGLKALAKTEKGREAVKAMGYQEGQDVNMPTGQSTDMMQDPIVQETIQFILGETDNSDIVNEFIVKYGQEQFMILRDQILRQAAGNLDVQTEGLIRGNGNSGMADDLPMSIGADTTAAAVSQDEYIIPADVVSMLGDGSSDAGSKQLDAMLDRVRTEKTGTTKQAGRINPNKVLPV
tara:strand:+ start:9846 stop:12167 length:2322 start_codon:yes stop_codon:yes gene_type:complete